MINIKPKGQINKKSFVDILKKICRYLDKVNILSKFSFRPLDHTIFTKQTSFC